MTFQQKVVEYFIIECIFLSERRHYVTFHPFGIFGHHWCLLSYLLSYLLFCLLGKWREISKYFMKQICFLCHDSSNLPKYLPKYFLIIFKILLQMLKYFAIMYHNILRVYYFFQVALKVKSTKRLGTRI